MSQPVPLHAAADRMALVIDEMRQCVGSRRRDEGWLVRVLSALIRYELCRIFDILSDLLAQIRAGTIPLDVRAAGSSAIPASSEIETRGEIETGGPQGRASLRATLPRPAASATMLATTLTTTLATTLANRAPQWHYAVRDPRSAAPTRHRWASAGRAGAAPPCIHHLSRARRSMRSGTAPRHVLNVTSSYRYEMRRNSSPARVGAIGRSSAWPCDRQGHRA